MKRNAVFLIFCLLVYALLMGCEGAGSTRDAGTESKFITGIAATGAPAGNTIVYLSDAAGAQKNTTSASDGYYSIEVSGMQAPFVIWFDTGARTVYSTDCGSYVVNINPVSDVITRTIYAQAGGNGDPVASILENVDCSVAEENVKAIIQPILDLYGVSGNENLMSMSNFVANGYHLDGILDDFNILYVDGNIVVSSKLNNIPLVSVSAAGLSSSSDHISESDISGTIISYMLTNLADKIDVGDIGGANTSLSQVTGNLNLFTEAPNGVTASWVSSNTAVIANSGAVTRPAQDTGVELTMTLTKGDSTVEKVFVVTVLGTASGRYITGTAATGAPAAGITVHLSDVNGTSGSTTSAANGYYSIEVTGMSAPYVVWFDTGSRTLYSTDCGSEVININPLTDVMTRTMYTQAGGTGSPAASMLVNVDCAAVQDNTSAMIQPILDLYGVTGEDNFITMSDFEADGYGLDGIFDDFNITFENGQIIVSSKLDSTAIVNVAAAGFGSSSDHVEASDITSAIVTYMLTNLADKIDFEDIAGANTSSSQVTSDLNLFTGAPNGVTASWASSDTAAVSASGVVTRQTGNADVNLTMTLTKDSVSVTKDIPVTVTGTSSGSGGSGGLTDAESVAAAKAALDFDDIRQNNIEDTSVLFDLNLAAAGEDDTTITWSSSNTGYIGADGTVTRPGISEGAQTVTLTATITKGSVTDTKTFTLVVRSFVGTSVKGGLNTAVVLTDAGELFSEGANNYGQLGDGSTTASATFIAESTAASDWTDFAAGGYHTAAIKADGTLWSWGYNNYGQLGDGTTTNSSVPVQESTHAADWAMVVAGLDYTLAIKDDGTLWSWGHNNYGQLGNGTNTDSSVPVQESTGSSWKFVATGMVNPNGVAVYNRADVYGIKSDGTVAHWGNAVQSPTDYSVPAFFADHEPVQIALSNTTVIFLCSDGTIWGVGGNYFGQMGTGVKTANYTLTQESTLSTDWVSIAVGFTHVIALKSDGTVWTWGTNTDGQLGYLDISESLTPVQEPTLANDWVAVGAGAYASYGTKSNGEIWGWGYNDSGELGTTEASAVTAPEQTALSDFEKLASTTGTSYGIKSDGTLWAWGNNTYGNLGSWDSGVGGYLITRVSIPVQEPTGAANWSEISAGYNHVAALRTDGTVWTWGRNDFNQTGAQFTTDTVTPLQEPTASTDWVKVAAGFDHTMMLKSDGTLWGMGYDGSYQKGITSFYNTPWIPKREESLSTWTDVAAGYRFTLAIKSDGTLWGCGNSPNGQLGIGVKTNNNDWTQESTGATNWTQVAANYYGGGAIRSDGTLWLFGIELNSADPVQESSHSTDWVKIVAGERFISAMKTDGTVWTMGTSNYGILGDGSASGYSLTPIQENTGTIWDGIASGMREVYGFKDGEVFGWGKNSNSEVLFRNITYPKHISDK